MTRIEGSVFCDNCGVEITWTPVFRRAPPGKAGWRRGEYCCQICARGLPCTCSERMLLDEERRRGSNLSVETNLYS